MTNRGPGEAWTRPEERAREDLFEGPLSSHHATDPLEAASERADPSSRAGLVSVLERTFLTPRSPVGDGGERAGQVVAAPDTPYEAPSIRLDEETSAEALRGIGGPSLPTDRDAEEAPERPAPEEGPSPGRGADQRGAAIGPVGPIDVGRTPGFEGPSVLRGDLGAGASGPATAISGRDRPEARVTAEVPAGPRPWPTAIGDRPEGTSPSMDGVDPAWAPTTDPGDLSMALRAAMDPMTRAAEVSVGPGDVWKGPALVSAAWPASPGSPAQARLTVPAPAELGQRLAGGGASRGADAFRPAGEGPETRPGRPDTFRPGAVDGAGPSGRPETNAPDMARTNELLQQLLDEVRRGRVSYLPVQDRGRRSVD